MKRWLKNFLSLLAGFLSVIVVLWLLWLFTRNENAVGFTAIAIGLAAFLAGII